MNVVIVGPVYPFRGGIAHYTASLSAAFREHGHNVLVLSFKRQYPRFFFPGRSDRDPSQRPLVEVPAEYLIDSLQPCSWVAAVRRIIREHPDVVVMQWWTSFWAPAWLVIGALLYRFARSTRIVYICHNVLPHEDRPWDPWLARLVLRWGHAFIVQSEQERARFNKLLGHESVYIIPHPLYTVFARELPSKEEARRLLGLSLDAVVLLHFGIVRPYKGLKDVILALPQIIESCGDVHLLIVGEFWEPESRYQSLIEHLGLWRYIRVENRYIPNEEVPYYFSAADFFVASHHVMTGSGSIQIARAFGLPVIDRSVLGQWAQTPDDLARCIIVSLREKPPVRAVDEVSWSHLVEIIEKIVASSCELSS